MSTITKHPLKLNDSTLLRNQAYMNGAGIAGISSFEVIHPAIGEVIDSMPDLVADDAEAALPIRHRRISGNQMSAHGRNPT